MAAAAPLAQLQRQLERTYQVEIPQAVDDFVITDPELLAGLGSGEFPEIPEKLLIVEAGGDVDIGLFIDQVVIDAFASDDPTARIHPGNLETFCVALEGVSHFLYMLWNTSRARPVSLLELELQAEVDKFFAAAFLFARQQGGVPAALNKWLFGAPIFYESLLPTSRNRYEVANRYAGKFCARLEQQYMRTGQKAGLLNELRRFYRIPQREKLRYIEHTA